MQFNTYTEAGARIAVWLVNHPAPDAAALAAELHRYEVHEPSGTAAEAAALRPWAARLREVFEAAAVTDKAQLTDALLVAADCRPRLVSHGAGRPYHLHYAPVETGLAARVRALTAAGLAHVIDGGARCPAAGVRPGRVRRRVHRHLTQRAPPLLRRPLRQPGQRGQPPAAPALRVRRRLVYQG